MFFYRVLGYFLSKIALTRLLSHNSGCQVTCCRCIWHETTRKHGYTRGMLVLALCHPDTHLGYFHVQLAKTDCTLPDKLTQYPHTHTLSPTPYHPHPITLSLSPPHTLTLTPSHSPSLPPLLAKTDCTLTDKLTQYPHTLSPSPHHTLPLSLLCSPRLTAPSQIN